MRFLHSSSQILTLPLAVSKAPTGGYRIGLTKPLSYSHRGQGSTRAEVALVSRKIYIQGVDEPDPYRYDGGGEREGVGGRGRGGGVGRRRKAPMVKLV